MLNVPGDRLSSQEENELKEILSIVEQTSEFSEIIYNSSSYYKLNQLSCQRENIIQWYPFDKNATVLELCADCGAVTGGFLSKVKRVVSITDMRLKADIIKKRHGNHSNLHVLVGNYKELIKTMAEQFDYIIFIGGKLEEVELRNIRRLLSDKGKLLIATENRNGLKYLAGTRDEYTGGLYDGVDNYRSGNVLTYDMNTWKDILSKYGFNQISFRYPYPDYRFCEMIFSDDMLPEKGQLNKNIRNYDSDRVISFDEDNFFNNLIENGLFPLFSNSYFIETGNSSDEIYTKFSKERKSEYSVFTSISSQDDGKTVKKYPADEKAQGHICNMFNTEKNLIKIFEDDFFHVTGCKGDSHVIEFEFINGKSLEKIVDEHIYGKEFDRLYEDIEVIKRIADKLSTDHKFVCNQEFLNYFGDIVLQDDLTGTKISLIDLNLDNFIINEKINLIDYEWVLPFEVPLEFLIFRALFLSKAISTLPEVMKREIYQYVGVPYDLYDTFLAMEIKFQGHISSNDRDMGRIWLKMQKPIYDLKYVNFNKLLYVSRISDADNANIITFRGQMGNGGYIEANLDKEVANVLFEPAQTGIFIQKPRIVAIKNEKEIEVTDYIHNADLEENGDLLFGEKPKILIKNKGYNKIKISFVAYLWDTNLVKMLINEKLQINHMVEFAEKHRWMYKLCSMVESVEK